MGKKRKNKTKRKLNIFRLFILLSLITTFIVAGAGIGFLVGVVNKLPEFKNPGEPDWNLTTFVYDNSGQEIAKLHGVENREPVEFKAVPQNLKDAFIAIEDNDFEHHFGVNPKAIARAVWANIRHGFGAEGGSTITQQLAKNAFLKNPEKKLKRKIQEALLAIQLERTYTKDEIFEFYLNTIYFGHGANGVQAASQTYFGKNVQDLDLAESSLLAGVANLPGRYSPYIDEDAATKRRARVLDKMVELNYISKEQAEEAKKEPFNLVGLKKGRQYNYPYFMDHVIEDAEKLLRENNLDPMALYTGGLKVYTTLNKDVQQKIEEVYNNPDNFPTVDTEEPVQSAMVILDPHTGAIQGLVGGREHVTKRGLNRATQMRSRQPGSVFKPLAVYGPALENGLSPGTVIDDVPVSIPLPTGTLYEPSNYDGNYRGLISMREAVRYSVNVPAVKVLDQIGTGTGYDFATNLGLTHLAKQDRNFLSIALGGLTSDQSKGYGVTPLELAAAYGSFANKGVYVEPYAITKITDKEGNVIVETKQKKHIAMTEETAYLMTDILTTVVKDSKGRTGTGWRAAIPGWQVAGKTGTTQLTGSQFDNVKGNKDAWFAGYTPEYAGIVWMGFDKTDKDHYLDQVYGGKYPAMLWKAAMEEALKDKEPKPFERPNGIVNVTIDSKTGLLPNELTPQEFVTTELFAKNTVPQQVSDIWQETEVCAESGKLPTPFCPDIITGIFFKRPIPYTAENKNEIPLDVDWEVPRELCDIHNNSTTVLLSTCTDPRHEGKLVLANISGPGQEGGCPEEYIVHRVFPPGTAPSAFCNIEEHQVVDQATGKQVNRHFPGNWNSGAPKPDKSDQTSPNEPQEKPERTKPPEPVLSGNAITDINNPNMLGVQLQWEVDQTQLKPGQQIVYFIERWTDTSQNKLNIALTNTTTWFDEEVKTDNTYFYRVTAIDVNTSLTALSNSVEVQVKEIKVETD